MFKKFLILLMMPLICLGCKSNGFNLKIRYDQIQGLKQGDRVIFEQNHIGMVKGVIYSNDGFFIVDLVIKKDFAINATEHSRFFIINDPQNNSHKAVEMIQTREGGAPLQDNIILDGSTMSSALFDQLMEGFEKGFEDLKKRFEQFAEDLSKVPESKAFKELENELKCLSDEMKRSGKAMREKIQKELLPRLKKEMEKLRERLRKFGREEELKPLEIEMEKIRKI